MSAQLVLLTALTLTLPAPVHAQATSGKLTGITTSAYTGEALAGVEIHVEGSGLGALTAENGRYFIVNVPPGTYTVVAEILGYQMFRLKNVLVAMNATRTVDFQLTPQAIAVEEIRVEVESTPLIEVDARGSLDLISSEQLESLPAVTVEQALELKQGYFTVPDNENILAFTAKARGISPVRIRGGRNGETVTMIDGIPVNNFIFGGAAFSLTKAAVGQLTFRKGGLPAMYGNALSGVVDIATKEPAADLAGSFEYQTSKLAGVLGSAPDKLNDFDFLEGYLTGPIPGTADKLRFLVAGRTSSQAARVLEFDDDVFDPTNPPDLSRLNRPNSWDIFPGWWAFGYDDEQQVFGKLTYLFTPTSKLNFSVVHVRNQFQRYDFDYFWTYHDGLESPVITSALDSLWASIRPWQNVVVGSVATERMLFVGTFSNVWGRTFLNINGGVFSQRRQNCNFFQGICLEDNFANTNYGGQFARPGITLSHPTRGTDDLFGGEDISTYVLRADVQSQVSDHHSLSFGVFADIHALNFDENNDEGAFEVFVVNQRYIAKPWDAAFYLRDVIEYDFLRLDLGLRVDIGKAGGLFFVDPLNPTNGTTAREVCENPSAFGPVVDPVTGETVTPNPSWTLLSCSDPAVREEAAIIAYADDFEESSTRTQVSPRLGISFPVTANSSVFFNYAINTQNPLMNNIFQNTSIGTEGEALPCGLRGVTRDAVSTAGCGPIIFADQWATSFLGNPNLLIEKTSTYELGYLAEIGDDYALSAILFNKDQSGLTGVRDVTGIQDVGATYGSSSPTYAVLVNEDFQTVRGIEVNLRRRIAGYWGFELNYSYSQARTNAAPPEREFQSVAEEADPSIRREIRSEVDIPHAFNGVLQFVTAASAPAPALQYSNFSISLQARSGIPYTPTTSFDGVGEGNQLERNSGRGPATWQVNLRAQKGISFGGMLFSLFVQAFNVFDTLNCYQPFPTTGRCDAGTRDQDRRRHGEGSEGLVRENVSSTFFDRPHLFGPRRQINFGVRMDF